jgi:hypothetical protein
VYALADKYDVQSLRTLASQKFAAVLDSKKPDDIIAAIEMVDNLSLGDEFWPIVIDKIESNLSDLVEHEGLLTLLLDMPYLVKTLLKRGAPLSIPSDVAPGMYPAVGYQIIGSGGRRLG